MLSLAERATQPWPAAFRNVDPDLQALVSGHKKAARTMSGGFDMQVLARAGRNVFQAWNSEIP